MPGRRIRVQLDSSAFEKVHVKFGALRKIPQEPRHGNILLSHGPQKFAATDNVLPEREPRHALLCRSSVGQWSWLSFVGRSGGPWQTTATYMQLDIRCRSRPSTVASLFHRFRPSGHFPIQKRWACYTHSPASRLQSEHGVRGRQQPLLGLTAHEASSP